MKSGEPIPHRPPSHRHSSVKLIRRLNQPLSAESSALGHSLFDRGPAQDDEWLVLLAFSGGGTRAAALSYGVLEELSRTTFHKNGRERRMLDEVDAISAVSGGSFTAAYYALHGDRIFSDFERLFLKKDVQGALWRQVVHPQHWWSLFSKQIGRSDLAGDFYDNELFGGATFGELLKNRNRPNLIINATDMVTGRPFAFTQRFFDLIESDLMALPLARAVAASSAAPLVLSPLTLRNYAGQNAAASSAFLQHFQADALADGAPPELTENMVSYLDAADRPFIHLVDGGVSDNLGLRGLLDVSAMNGGFTELLKRWELAQVRKIAVIVVNAAAQHGARWNHGSNPGMVDVLQAVSEHATHLASARTITDLRTELEQWRRHESPGVAAADRAFHVVEVGFERIADPVERSFFRDLPTTLTLPGATVERLREVGGRLLRESAAFRRLRDDFELTG